MCVSTINVSTVSASEFRILRRRKRAQPISLHPMHRPERVVARFWQQTSILSRSRAMAKTQELLNQGRQMGATHALIFVHHPTDDVRLRLFRLPLAPTALTVIDEVAASEPEK